MIAPQPLHLILISAPTRTTSNCLVLVEQGWGFFISTIDPKNFKITIRDLSLSAGAGFIVALTGKIMTMPGLPAVPAAVKMEDEGI